MRFLKDLEVVFGVLAYRSGKVDEEQLLDAVRERLRGRDDPLWKILEGRGHLSTDDREEVDRLVAGQLRANGDDSGRLLDSLGAEELLGDLDSRMGGGQSTSRETSSRCDPATTAGQSQVETADFDPRVDRETQSFLSTEVAGEGVDGGPGGEGSTRSNGSRFRLLSFYAKGGIGEVYRARDEELGRIVALKRLQPSYAGNESYRSRFVIEAEINGNLEHPGIVPVHGFGYDRDGRPFYAMRMVRGQTLHKAIVDYHRRRPGLDGGERSLRLRELLGRFLVVCEAMAYAHFRGVLHRDLKPSNVMLGRYGETQIIDWGLAKATGRADPASSDSDDQPEPTVRPASGSGLDPTRAGSVIGTLEYICPEAAAGASESLGVPCDIYGLGAILFAILTGRPPARGKDTHETRRIARENAIPAPRSLLPDLPRPLEAICMKALAGNPEERYASALDLARDVRRWMADEPILALEDGLADRLARWERSHRTLVRVGSAASVLIAAVAVAAAVLISGARDAAEASRSEAELARGEAQENADAATEAMRLADAERRLAEERYDQVQTIVEEFLEPMVDGLYLMPGSSPLRVAMAEMLVSHYRDFLRGLPDDPEIRRQAARIFRIAANIERMTGKDEEAGLLYDEGLGVADRIDDPMPGAWLLLDRAEWHRMNGRTAAAFDDLAAAEARARAADPADREVGPDRRPRFEGVLALNRAGLHFTTGRFAEAEAGARDAGEWFTRLVDAGDSQTTTRVLQVFADVLRVSSVREQGRSEEAAAGAEAVFTLARTYYNPRSFDPNMAVAYASAVQEWAMLPVDLVSNPAFVLSRLDQSVIARIGLLNQNADIASFRIGLAGVLNDRAAFRHAIGQADKAGADATQGLLVIEKAPERIRSLPSIQRERGRAEELLAELAGMGGDAAEERRHLEAAVAAFEAACERDPDRFHDRRDADRLRTLLAGGGETQRPSSPGIEGRSVR